MEAGWLAVSLGLAGIGSPDGSAGGAGSLWGSARVAGPARIELGVQEGVIAGPGRVVTGIHADGRFALGERIFLRTGFVHQHETELDLWKQDAAMVTLGASEAIHHRTGGELGLGGSWAMPSGRTAPVHLSLSASVAAFPDLGGPHVYGIMETLVTIPIGKARAAES